MSAKTGTYDQPGSLMQQTSDLLRNQDLLKVYEETRISFYWLRKFASGSFRNPSVNRVQYLYEHLSGTKLLG